MKVEQCQFSHFKIHPGHGLRFTRIDGKSHFFITRKAQSLHLQRKNPRKICWTLYYRTRMKKGITTENSKKRAKKVVKMQRAVGDISKEEMMKRATEKSDFRKVQRETAIRAAKEAAKAKAKTKAKKSSKPAQPKMKIAKNQNAGRGKR